MSILDHGYMNSPKGRGLVSGDLDANALPKETGNRALCVDISDTLNDIRTARKVLNEPVQVHMDEVDELLRGLRASYDKGKFDDLIKSCQESVTHALIRPFGLGKILFEDKDGATVTTVHNAQQGIYARGEDEYDRSAYTNSRNSNNEKFEGDSKKSVGSQFTRGQLDKDGNLQDAYTGKTIKGSDSSPDHVISLSEYHKNGGFMQSDRQKADFATDGGNLASTDRSINQSMRDKDKREWSESKSAGRDETNAEHFEIDQEKLDARYEKGRATADQHAPTTTEKTKYYAINAARTGIKEGAKMGLQQSMGVVLEEFARAVFAEAKDIWASGFKERLDERFIDAMKTRLHRIATRVASKWQDAVEAFKDGALSGFLSNLATLLVNMFKTTLGRLGRVIREGFLSLLKALKLLIFPPEGMEKWEAAHEASKIFASGVIIAGGLLLEEAVEKAVTGFFPVLATIPMTLFGSEDGELTSLASVIASTLTAVCSGLAVVFSVYLLDKMDIFGVERENQHAYVMGELDGMIGALAVS